MCRSTVLLSWYRKKLQTACSQVRTKDYGALSLAVQYYAEPYVVANVPPNCFMPRPKVGSAVIRLTKYKDAPIKVTNEKLLFQLIRASFNQRRKTLQNGIKNFGGLNFSKEQVVQALEEMELPASVRGEALTLEQFAQLSNILDREDKNNQNFQFYVVLAAP